MQERKAYEVLHLLGPGKKSENTLGLLEGRRLVEVLKEEEVDASRLFGFLQDFITCFQQLHSTNQVYGYFNPYALLVDETYKVYFLNFSTKDNQKERRYMEQKQMHRFFLPEGRTYSESLSKEEDYYGMGKTLQYILHHRKGEPLTKGEESCLKKILKICFAKERIWSREKGRRIRNLLLMQEKRKERRKKSQALALLKIGVLALALSLLFWKQGFFSHTREGFSELEQEIFLFFLLEGEKVEEEYWNLFSEKWKGAKDIRDVWEWTSQEQSFQGGKGVRLEALRTLEERMDPDSILKVRLLSRLYFKLNQKEGYERIVKLTQALKPEEYENDLEVQEFKGISLEKLGKIEEAIQVYQNLARMVSQEQKEGFYKKVYMLYESLGRVEEGENILKEGIEETWDGQELRLLYIQEILKKEEEKESKERKIEEQIRECPGLLSLKSFEKLKTEYHIQVQEGKVVIE